MNAPASGIGRLARVLSPSGRGLRDRVCALLAAYLDKSSDHPQGITSIAGYVATLDEWQNVERVWDCGVRFWSRLEGFRALGGFHMADLQNAIGIENAQLCIKYFTNIVTNADLHAIGAAILDADWHNPDWRHDVTPRRGSVYEQCLDLALRVLGEHVSSAFPSQQIDVVFCRDENISVSKARSIGSRRSFQILGRTQ
jgi:hypothetical protein